MNTHGLQTLTKQINQPSQTKTDHKNTPWDFAMGYGWLHYSENLHGLYCHVGDGSIKDTK